MFIFINETKGNENQNGFKILKQKICLIQYYYYYYYYYYTYAERWVEGSGFLMFWNKLKKNANWVYEI